MMKLRISSTLGLAAFLAALALFVGTGLIIWSQNSLRRSVELRGMSLDQMLLRNNVRDIVPQGLHEDTVLLATDDLKIWQRTFTYTAQAIKNNQPIWLESGQNVAAIYIFPRFGSPRTIGGSGGNAPYAPIVWRGKPTEYYLLVYGDIENSADGYIITARLSRESMESSEVILTRKISYQRRKGTDHFSSYFIRSRTFDGHEELLLVEQNDDEIGSKSSTRAITVLGVYLRDDAHNTYRLATGDESSD